MGIHREYARLTSSELQRALTDPTWAGERLDELADMWVDADLAPEAARFLSVDKSWPGIDFVMASAGLSVRAINGARELPTADEWDYGNPTYLASAEVNEVSDRLAAVSMTELVSSVDANAVRAENIYHVGDWTDDDRDYVAHHAEQLKRFYAAAATAGDVVVAMLT